MHKKKERMMRKIKKTISDKRKKRKVTKHIFSPSQKKEEKLIYFDPNILFEEKKPEKPPRKVIDISDTIKKENTNENEKVVSIKKVKNSGNKNLRNEVNISEERVVSLR